MEQIIYIENNDKKTAAHEIKRAYVNKLGAEICKKYLAQEDIDVSGIYSLHDIDKMLEKFDVADVILKNIHIDVRVVYDENLIFVPKSHFEWGLVPDVYFVLLMNDTSCMKFLGFFEPRLINKNNQNSDYYFIEKEKLSSPVDLKQYIKDFKGDYTEKLSDDELEKCEFLAVSFNDDDISDYDEKYLIKMLVKSAELRKVLTEFGNFEKIAIHTAASDVLDNITEVCTEAGIGAELPDMDEFSVFNASDVELADNLTSALPQDEIFSDEVDEEPAILEPDETFDGEISGEENALTDEKSDYIDEIFSDIDYEREVGDDDVMEDFTQGDENLSQDTIPDDISNETTDEITDEVTDEIVDEIPDEIDLENIGDSPLETIDENIDLNETLDLENIDAAGDLAIPDETFEQNLENFDEVEQVVDDTENQDDEQNLESFDEVEQVVDDTENKEVEQDLESFAEVEQVVDDTENQEVEQNLESFAEVEQVVDDTENQDVEQNLENFDEIQVIEPDEKQETQENFDTENIENTKNISFDDIMLGNAVQEISQETSKEIFEDESAVSYENSQEISNENMIEGEIQIDINEPKEEKDLKVLYNKTDDILTNKEIYLKPQELGKKAILAASVIIAALVSLLIFAALHKTENKAEQPANVLEKNIPQTEEQPVPELPEVLPPTQETVAAVQKPAQNPAQNPTPYTDVKKLGWAVPDYLSYNDAFKNYLQTAGKSLRLTLSSDLLLATEYAYSQEIDVDITLTKEGSLQSAKIQKSSGSKQIDDIVLQTVNETLKVVKAPAGLIVGDTAQMILKIYL